VQFGINSTSCWSVVGVVFWLLYFYTISNKLFIQLAHYYTFCVLFQSISLLLLFCTLIQQPISVLLQIFALFMVTSKQHNTGYHTLFNRALELY